MSLRELTDVLTALLFYNFLLSFMLTGCIESDITRIRPGLTSQKRVNYFCHSKKILSKLGSSSKLKTSSARHLQCFRYTFTTDVAAGKIMLMTGFSGTTDFLKHHGILYDTFGITCKASTSQPIKPEQVIQNLNMVA